MVLNNDAGNDVVADVLPLNSIGATVNLDNSSDEEDILAIHNHHHASHD